MADHGDSGRSGTRNGLSGFECPRSTKPVFPSVNARISSIKQQSAIPTLKRGNPSETRDQAAVLGFREEVSRLLVRKPGLMQTFDDPIRP